MCRGFTGTRKQLPETGLKSVVMWSITRSVASCASRSAASASRRAARSVSTTRHALVSSASEIEVTSSRAVSSAASRRKPTPRRPQRRVRLPTPEARSSSSLLFERNPSCGIVLRPRNGALRQCRPCSDRADSADLAAVRCHFAFRSLEAPARWTRSQPVLRRAALVSICPQPGGRPLLASFVGSRCGWAMSVGGTASRSRRRVILVVTDSLHFARRCQTALGSSADVVPCGPLETATLFGLCIPLGIVFSDGASGLPPRHVLRTAANVGTRLLRLPGEDLPDEDLKAVLHATLGS
jgi:hypothetical protein